MVKAAVGGTTKMIAAATQRRVMLKVKVKVKQTVSTAESSDYYTMSTMMMMKK